MIAQVRQVALAHQSIAAQDQFLEMLPQIKQQALIAFRRHQAEDREELTQEVIANAYVAFTRLVQLGRRDIAYATPLAQYAVRQVRAGRRVGCRLNRRDVMSPVNCHRCLLRLDQVDSTDANWKEIVVEDRHATPAVTAAARLDLEQWFRLLPKRKRQLAKVLARGESTSTAAKQFGITPARVSQLRQELRQSWRQLQGELTVA
jgi:hypothetical protein